jgi:predicted RNA-binding Zn-ribbon protein involved in translation (DUF1610 family)
MTETEFEEEDREKEDLEQRVAGAVSSLKAIGELLFPKDKINHIYFVGALYRMTLGYAERRNRKLLKTAAEKILNEGEYRTKKENKPFCESCGLDSFLTDAGQYESKYGCPGCGQNFFIENKK